MQRVEFIWMRVVYGGTEERRKIHAMVSVGVIVINEYDCRSSGYMSEVVFITPLWYWLSLIMMSRGGVVDTW